jgi:hypothetical protein
MLFVPGMLYGSGPGTGNPTSTGKVAPKMDGQYS